MIHSADPSGGVVSFSLTEAQFEVWIAQLIDPHSPRYNCAAYLDIPALVNLEQLEQAIRLTLQETEVLRVRFETSGNAEVKQVLMPVPEQVLECIDLRNHPDAVPHMHTLMRQDLGTVQPLQGGQLLRQVFFQLPGNRGVFYLRYHHILMDGFGQSVYWKRISEHYTALMQGVEAPPSAAVGLQDILQEEQQYLQSSSAEKDQQFWEKAFSEPPEPVFLSESTALEARGLLRQVTRCAPEQLEHLRELVQQGKTRWSAVALAATAIYLYRITGHPDVVLSLPLPARMGRSSMATPVMLTNTLPLQLSLSPDLSVQDVLSLIGIQLGKVLRHQRFRGEKLQRMLGPATAGTVTVNVVSFDHALEWGGVPVQAHYLSSGPVQDLLIGFYGQSDASELQVYFDANPARHSSAALQDHQKHLMQVFSSLIQADLHTPISALQLLLPEEKQQLQAWHDTQVPYDLSRPLQDLLDAQATRTPSQVALTSASRSLTYQEVKRESDKLAAHLQNLGVRPGDLVGICQSRSVEMVLSLVATLKAGAAFLPLDPEFPESRLQDLLDDAGAKWVLVDGTAAWNPQSETVQVFKVQDLLSGLPEATPEPRSTPGSAAYVLYTSGSTGKPKGVVVPHRGLVNRLLWMQDAYLLSEEDCVLQKTPFTFDVSMWEFFWPLMTGARLHVLEPTAHRDPRRLAQVMQHEKITTLHFVPPMLDVFLQENASMAFPHLKRVVCSGEALRPETVGQFFEKFDSQQVGLYNLYGPTEASIDVTAWTCTPQDASRGVPIGFPVSNTRIYILDATGQELPPGRVGELYLAGVQVATGYLHREDLTRERFLPDPWNRGQRMYRTGDLGRRRQDGAIEYLGRIDHQVKIRGLRIEPAEVDSVLLSLPGVTQALTVVQRDAQNPRLVSYVTLQEGMHLEESDLLHHTSRHLPAYMVPSSVMALEHFPMLSNGKIDRKALPMQGIRESRPTEVLTEHQQQVAQAWEQVLGIHPALQDSFFGLGGDSLTSIRLRSVLERQGLTFELRDLFTHPTLQEMADRVVPLQRQQQKTLAPFALLSAADRARLPEGLQDAYPVSTMQRGMLFQAEKAPDSGVYRVVTSVQVKSVLNLEALKKAIQDTTARHPILRSSFDLSSFSVPVQMVHSHVVVPIHVDPSLQDLTDVGQQQALESWMAQAKTSVFDVTQAPLMHFTVHLRSERGFQLSVVEHHVILDGWSDAAMLDEILTRYQACLEGQDLWLPELPCSYRDFVGLEREALKDPSSRAYWSEKLSGAESTPLPRVSQMQKVKHQAFEVPLSAHLAAGLQELARKNRWSLKSVLAAAHLAVLRVVCASSRVLTGLVVHGRPESEGGDSVLGVFLNTLPLHIETGHLTFREAIEEVQHFEQEAWPHRRFPIGEMQRDLDTPFELDSYLNFIDFHDHLHASKHPLIAGGMGVAETDFPMAVNFLMDPTLGQLRAWLDCNVGMLDEDFCHRLCGYYRVALEALIRDPEQHIDQLDLLDRSERLQLQMWNSTAVSHDRTTTIHRLIEQQVERTPDRVAVTSRFESLSYRELNLRANQLAHELITLGAGPGHKVGVYLRRSTEMVVALLGILKAGAAYVPLDPSFPRNRLEFIVQDAGMTFLLTDQTCPMALSGRVKQVLRVHDLLSSPEEEDLPNPQDRAVPQDTAYVIYTSGSTGLPKGTILRHENVTNFFVGMQGTVGCTEADTLLAVTSISFDISVLELLWPLTCGAHVVVAGEQLIQRLLPPPEPRVQAPAFSLFFFAAATRDEDRQEGYRLVLEAARFADTHGFEAIWTPERHFHDFGGLYPNPSVMSAALSTLTRQVKLRSGSVVAPLHDPVRLAEEWSLVDNLSGGRVGLAFASGWNANDFALAPENYASRKQVMEQHLEEFRTLWAGKTVQRTSGRGENIEVRIYPTPVQKDVEVWFTSSGAVETFRRAGRAGVNVLTHLLGQDLQELQDKIQAYREARREAGFTTPGKVTLMIHTFLHEDAEEARRIAREPFKNYLRTSTELWSQLFASMGIDFQGGVNPEDLEDVLDLAVDRYFERSGLFGSALSVAPLVQELVAAGVNELACLIDFGVPTDQALEGLRTLNELREQQIQQEKDAPHSFAALCDRHQVTMFQSTPSFLSAVVAEPQALSALKGTRAVLVGGEAFPSGLAHRLMDALEGTRICNMYGPTETTIWSTVHELGAKDLQSSSIPIGSPIANTQVHVLDAQGRELPADVPGELWIGGEGVASGYLNREELTREKFVLRPGSTTPLYRTGDRVRWRKDGVLEFAGRVDRQVKIRGHRVEPDEVESVLSRHPGVESVAVIASDQGNGLELLAFVTENAHQVQPALEDAVVDRWSEVWEAAYAENGVDREPDFSGWKSSYTDLPIPEGEMQEWLGHTLQRLQNLSPRRMLEVGVGVGLILQGMLPHVEHYRGLDVSQSALTRALLGVKLRGEDPRKVNLHLGDARTLGRFASGEVDTVVFNSVVQYFPSAHYLRDALQAAWDVLPDTGTLFVGDVRHLHWLEAFHASVECHRADLLTPVGEIARKVKRRVQEEQELCLAPGFFQNMLSGLGAGDVRLELKRGHFENELTVFRFDATLRKTPGEPITTTSCKYEDLTQLEQALQQKPDAALHITGIPNRRLVRPLKLAELLHTLPADTTLWEVERLLWSHEVWQALDPEALFSVAEAQGRTVQVLLSADGSLDTFEAVFGPSQKVSSNAEPLDSHAMELRP
ncbi:non-ribosomal peptide synthetase [Deinococcus cellulosilyticus]|uniref:Carrier domain-containing protein n=1 Tax=Deinococcus cellulosilyticus (strain DSM 18568 / NBRC 106333 / KACC 11606 / 5516J-15) TaxID=1223518 RepID=A0A511N208_DEIC1|nr:non-ribosomal peptide synthetase [Deinococcus cellulosilyticus]GEM46883.1 hypothetical protein DC3_25180 [Deinococcus cellulosilyticus NBRC 106333 = KACC 11606]